MARSVAETLKSSVDRYPFSVKATLRKCLSGQVPPSMGLRKGQVRNRSPHRPWRGSWSLSLTVKRKYQKWRKKEIRRVHNNNVRYA